MMTTNTTTTTTTITKKKTFVDPMMRTFETTITTIL